MASVMEKRTRRFGILSFGVAPYASLEQEWIWAEEVGFDSIWIPDTWSIAGFADFEAWTLLAGLARSTSRVRIGTLVTTIIPRHPTLLAAEALTIDHLSFGRVDVGIGVGDRPADCDVLGLPRWPRAERFARLEEQLAILDQLLRGDTVSHQGVFYSLLEAHLVAPVQRPRPPIVVAAEGPRALRVAAQYADGWSTLGGQPPTAWAGGTTERVTEAQAIDATRNRVEQLVHRCVELGRDPRSIRRILLAYRRPVDPLSSLDAFDHFVGSYEQVGIDEFVFYWPPLASVREHRQISAAERAIAERITAERIAASADWQPHT